MPANTPDLLDLRVEDPPADSGSCGATSSEDEAWVQPSRQKEQPCSKPASPWYSSLPSRSRHEDFIRKAVDILVDKAVFQGTSRANKVSEWKDPEELLKILKLQPESAPESEDKLLKRVEDIIKYSVKTGHPYFVNQLFSAVDPYGLVGQWLGDALNPSVYTYEVAPAFVLMEETVLAEMRSIVGFPGGRGDGIFCPGGSMANGYAISCARHSFNSEVKSKGVHASGRLVLFTSEDAHYSVKKMACFMGIGSDNVYMINTDRLGRMDPSHLETEVQRAVSEGAHPFMVSATAGTTVLGAFDPLPQISAICKKYGLWFHVDAAWGGGALVSKKYKHLLNGIESADSVTWNPHKLLTAPQQCSTLLVRHQGLLSEVHSASATYLFQKDKFYDTQYDTGDKHIQCGRRADVLKFWFMWKAKGTEGLERHVDKVFENSEYFTQTIREREGFELVLEKPECTNICFWYVPPSLRECNKDDDYKDKLHRVAPKIKERMMKEGTMMVTYQPQHDLPNFFRIVFQNSGLEQSDMIYFVNEIERLGCDL